MKQIKLGIYPDFLGHSDCVNSVAFSPDGAYILSGSDDKSLKLWDRQTGKIVKSYEGHSNRVNSVAFSPDGAYILSGSADKSLKLWDRQTGKIVKSYPTTTLDTEIQPIFSEILKSYGQDFSSSYGLLTCFDCKLTIIGKETPLFCESMILLNPLELTDPNKTVFLQRGAINLS